MKFAGKENNQYINTVQMLFILNYSKFQAKKRYIYLDINVFNLCAG